MFFTQFFCTTISFTWRIIGFTCPLISTAKLFFLIFKWWRCFSLIMFLFVRYNILFTLLLVLSGSWIIYFSLIKVSKVFFLLSLQGICCLSGDSVVSLDPGIDILEILGLSLLTSIYFGCSMFVLLWDKLADEIDLALFIYFTVSYISVL